ncbi:MAG TPA: hydrogenase maturation protease [Candidatus Limnocylindrales bacterium]
MNAPIFAVRLLVCGNADRGDDGAALAAVAHLLPRIEDSIRHRIDVRRCAQLDATDLIDVPAHQVCVVVDTVVGVDPGAVVKIPLADLAAAESAVAPRSSHVLPIGQVLGIAAAIRGQLPDGVFIGIGGKRFGFGSRRSRAITGGMRAFERTIEGEVRRVASAALVAGPGGHPGV